jgi:hypothetical protein
MGITRVGGNTTPLLPKCLPKPSYKAVFLLASIIYYIFIEIIFKECPAPVGSSPAILEGCGMLLRYFSSISLIAINYLIISRFL